MSSSAFLLTWFCGVVFGASSCFVAERWRAAWVASPSPLADPLDVVVQARGLDLPGFEFVVDGAVQVAESLLRLHLARGRVGRVDGWTTQHTVAALAVISDLETAIGARPSTGVEVIPIGNPRRWS